MSISEKIELRFGSPVELGEGVSSNTTLCGILDHRSCRRFQPDPVPGDLLQTLFAAAFSAPSKSDLQQASVVRIDDRRRQRRIAALSSDTAWVAAAPIFMVWCGDSRRIRRLGEWRGHPFANDHLDAFMNAAVDAGIAMQTFIIAAEAVGLGCCPVSQIRDHVRMVSSELELPKWVFPVAGLCVGWPAGEAPISPRLPLRTTVHADRYDDRDLIDQVTAYDRRREAVERTPPQQQRMVERFGVSSDYGWSENRTRQYAVPARADFGRYVRDQGFDLS